MHQLSGESCFHGSRASNVCSACALAVLTQHAHSCLGHCHTPLRRELVHYQGEKDPFKGDALNQRVRDAAKETVDALYLSSAAPVSSNSMAPRVSAVGPTRCCRTFKSSAVYVL